MINGKSYIGQHIVKKECNRQYMGKGIGIQEAYKKYGRKSFKKEILEEIIDDETRNIVSEREKYWISYYNTLEPNGYNRHPGGLGGCTSRSAKLIVDTKKKHGYKMSQKTKEKISKGHLGKKFSDEHRQHLSENHHLKTKHIINFENGSIEETYDSIEKIAHKYNTSVNSLIRKSAEGIFVNGIKLENIDATKYKCCQKENYSDIKVYDPIEKETCTYVALRARKYRNKTLYKNVIVMKQNLSGIGDA